MEYKLVQGQSPAQLETNVSAALAEGWEPQGGVAVSAWEFTTEGQADYTQKTYVQAMIRRDSLS
jgi:hypothetical protein